MELLNEIATWTVLIIWFLGALCALLGLGMLGSHLIWRAVVEIKGWRTIGAALREYRQRHAKDLDG